MSSSATVSKIVPMPITPDTARRFYDAGAVLVDIRPQVARHQGSIPNAVLVEADEVGERFNPDSPRQLAGVDFQREIVVCSVSSRRAVPAAEQLRRLGYDRVYVLSGGFSDWQDAQAS
jgi:rhodanese-related sulfurtransferase